MTTRQACLLVIFVAMLVIAAGYASAFLPGGTPRVATFGFALATAAVMTAVIVLGAARPGSRLGALRWVFAFTFLVLATGFCAALTQSDVARQPLWLGLPRGAAIILYIIGLLPMAVLPIAYAMTFDRTTLDESELAELRKQLEGLRASKQEDEGVEVLR